MAAFPTLLKEQIRVETYRNYIAEVGRYVTENTAKLSGGSYIRVRYEDVVSFKPEDTRTGEEIIAQVRRAIGGETNEPI